MYYKYYFRQLVLWLMKDKKAAKLIIKRAKKHPDWYSEKEVYYAKMMRKQIKEEEKECKNNE